MCVRRHTYLVCTNCNNQFIDRDRSRCWDVAEYAKTIRKIAKDQGWKRAKVANGSMWDFCPRCWAKHAEEAG